MRRASTREPSSTCSTQISGSVRTCGPRPGGRIASAWTRREACTERTGRLRVKDHSAASPKLSARSPPALSHLATWRAVAIPDRHSPRSAWLPRIPRRTRLVLHPSHKSFTCAGRIGDWKRRRRRPGADLARRPARVHRWSDRGEEEPCNAPTMTSSAWSVTWARHPVRCNHTSENTLTAPPRSNVASRSTSQWVLRRNVAGRCRTTISIRSRPSRHRFDPWTNRRLSVGDTLGWWSCGDERTRSTGPHQLQNVADRIAQRVDRPHCRTRGRCRRGKS